MNILWLTENYPPQRGGMSQSCDRIVDHLRRSGHIIDVLHFTEKSFSSGVVQQVNGWYVDIPFEESEAHTLNIAWEFVKRKSVQAVVCFGGYLPMLAAPVFSKWLSVPLLTMVRGNDFDSAVFTPRKRDIMRDAVEGAHTVCAVSNDKVEKISKLYPGVNVCYVPNGIDTQQWVPSPSELAFAEKWRSENATGKICVGLFGQLKAKKGISFLLNALRKLTILEQIHFLLVGETGEDVQQLLSSNEYSFTNSAFLDRFELLKYYLCCDAIAIPSFYDGMPNVLLEAGALGIPVIASATGGMYDVIRDRQSGMLFHPADASACRKAFFDFVELSASQRAQMGAALKLTINTTYHVQSETNHYDQLLKILLDSHRTAAVRLHVR